MAKKMNLSTFSVALFGKIKGWIDPRLKAAENRLEALEERQRNIECELAALRKEAGKNG